MKVCNLALTHTQERRGEETGGSLGHTGQAFYTKVQYPGSVRKYVLKNKTEKSHGEIPSSQPRNMGK